MKYKEFRFNCKIIYIIFNDLFCFLIIAFSDTSFQIVKCRAKTK